MLYYKMRMSLLPSSLKDDRLDFLSFWMNTVTELPRDQYQDLSRNVASLSDRIWNSLMNQTVIELPVWLNGLVPIALLTWKSEIRSNVKTLPMMYKINVFSLTPWQCLKPVHPRRGYLIDHHFQISKFIYYNIYPFNSFTHCNNIPSS